jgi:protocatechuate 3,4-dioxygenase beta subunit
MLSRKLTTTIFSLLIVSTIFINITTASEKEGMFLKFSLEAQPVAVTVSGKVTDTTTGEPIANAFVRGHLVIWKYDGPDLFEKCPYLETTTDTDGNYQLQFITPLTTSGPMKGKDGLCVYVSAAGYETKPKYGRPAVTPNNTNYPDFNFELGPGKLAKGVVIDEQNNPVEDARVRVQNGSNGDWNFFGSLGEAFTEKDGSFEVWFGTDNQYQTNNPWLCILKEGEGAGFYWDILDKDDMGTLILPSSGSISGRVVNARGKGIENCEVSVRGYPCDVIAKTLTDNNGNYLLQGIPGDPSIVEFYKKKSNSYRGIWGKVKVYAKVNPTMNLQDVPQYEIMVQDGETAIGPDLVIKGYGTIAGKLIGGETVSPAGLTVVLDGDWGNSVFTDAGGSFYFSSVAAGEHKITAYLLHNAQGSRGIGNTKVQVETGEQLQDVEIYPEEMAEIRVQFLDSDGNPLEGILAQATWKKNVDRPYINGTISDNQGWAVIYLYPDEVQYIHGHDPSKNLATESSEKIIPQKASLVNDVQILMIPNGSIKGRLLNEDFQPLEESVNYLIDFSDGSREYGGLKVDRSGFFEIKKIKPGIATLQLIHPFLASTNLSEQPLEIKSMQSSDIGDIVVSFHTAVVRGRLLRENGRSFTESIVRFKIDYTDDTEEYRSIESDSDGYFQIEKLRPGIANLSITAESMLYTNILKRIEIKEDETNDLGAVSLTGGIDKEKVLRDKRDHALENPEEIIEAAQLLFDGIRDADYDQILKSYVNGRWKKDGWKKFPPLHYQVYTDWPGFALWCCRTFKENPIIEIELGDVFLNKNNLPTVPYKLTLQDGTVLSGSLPFEYNFDGNEGHWHGIQGIDWHLKEQ